MNFSKQALYIIKNSNFNLRRHGAKKGAYIMNSRQKFTQEGLRAEKEAKEHEQVIKDFQYAIKYFLNPARKAIGLNSKKY